MVRTNREHALSWLMVIIVVGTMVIFYFIFGSNFLQNPFIVVFFLFFAVFITCWLFGYIHPVRWFIKRKLRDDVSYIKEAPKINTQDPLREEKDDLRKFICQYCGVLQDQKTNFCTKCGQKIKYT